VRRRQRHRVQRDDVPYSRSMPVTDLYLARTKNEQKSVSEREVLGSVVRPDPRPGQRVRARP